MADNDYNCVYRQFFEEFAKTETKDMRPIRVNLCDLSVDELVGEVMQSCVNYLLERNCPRSLVVPLTKIVVEELVNEAKKQPEEVDKPLKLNKKTHDKIAEVCVRYTDNEKLSNLPPPVQETYYSTHSTKHTRRRMEDRHICLPRFNTLHSIQSNSEAGYYGIFDGHSGVSAACYAVSHLHQFLAESEYYPDDPVQAFRQAIEKTEFRYNSKDENSGTTVLAILHQPTEKKLTVAWVGDSLAMLVNEDSYVMLVDPHKPERADERRRIEALGGVVVKVQNIHRVNGELAVSRAIGDKKLKPCISAEPEIRVLNLTGSEHFVVMGCDGLWDVVEPEEVIETVYFEVKKHEGKVDTVAKSLVDLAKENNSTDNISVIVFFLTDPSEICNRSVDVTGHRPKILHQDGVIMEANFQTNDKSPFNDPGMNGVFETNGIHFSDHIQNESDEDFGPETDVDAVDDVLTSPKNLNPFGKDCWQKTTEEDSEKLIEFVRPESPSFGGDIMKFSEGFTESANPIDDELTTQVNSNEVKSDSFSVDNKNPFETPVMNNMPEVSDTFSHFIDDNKYLGETNLRKEESYNFTSSSTPDEMFELKNDENILEKSQEEKADQNLFSFDSKEFTDLNQSASCTPTQDPDVSCKESSNSEVDVNLEEPLVESPDQKETVPEVVTEFQTQETSSQELVGSQTNEINTTLNNFDEYRDATFKTNDDETENLISQNMPLDATGNPPELCSVIDTVEAEKASLGLYPMEETAVGKEEEPSSELLSPSAPALDGELKDETVAESGGEAEDSEDDEWNYIKVDSGVHQPAPVDDKASDLVPHSNEFSEIEKPTMNSPLNPEADEFIPVSAMSHNNEFNLNMTPKKAIPEDLADIIASSPNWNNMNNVSVPDESAFLNDIKSRPSNIFENIESPQKDFTESNVVADNSLNFVSPGDNDKENVGLSENEPHGIDLAKDMTSSFIDPSTMSSEMEVPNEKSDILNSQIEDIVEKKEFYMNENAFKVEELANVEVTSESSLLSPVPKEEDASPEAPIVDVMDTIAVVDASPVATEQLISDFSQPPASDLQETKPANLIETTTPIKTENICAQPEKSPEALEKSLVEEPNETISPKPEEAAIDVTATAPSAAEIDVTATVASAAVATAAAAAAAVGVTAAKKDAKKPISKTTSTGVSKTPATSKPLLNGTKTTAATKKSTPSTQTTKATAPAKTTTTALKATTTATAPVSKTSGVAKTQPKPTTSVSSTLSKVQARPRPTSATSTLSKTSSSAKTTVTTSPTKTSTTATSTTLKSATKTSGSAPPTTTLKPKPRLSSATVEKKSTTALNGDAKSTTVRRVTEITKKPSGTSTVTTTTTTTTTRTALSARPSTAPTKPATLKTTTTTTRTITAKPRTTASNMTSSTLSPSNKTSPLAKKSTTGTDKQAKEAANRLTSKTTSTLKANGVVQRNTTTTVTKTRRTMTSTTTPTKTKTEGKTEDKADKILEEKVEIIKSENGVPSIENNTDINLINTVASG